MFRERKEQYSAFQNLVQHVNRQQTDYTTKQRAEIDRIAEEKRVTHRKQLRRCRSGAGSTRPARS